MKSLNLNDFIDINKRCEDSKRTPVKRKKSSSSVKSPLVVVKRDLEEEDVLTWISESKANWLEAMTETDLSPTVLYDYQTKYINDPNPFKHIDKSRQIGASYIFACEGLVNAMLEPKYTQIFISINQEEASEKIVYARALYESMDNEWPIEVRRPLVFDNKKLLEFDVRIKGTNQKSRTRIISHAQREPRGKGGNTFVVLDECAHYMFGEKIYVAALPITSRQGGMTLASTPLGKTGIHWEVMGNPMYQKIYSYHTIYWWNCPDFVEGGKFLDAQENAEEMDVVDRVMHYGSSRIKSIFVAMDIESFKQEYECHHIDESVSYFPMSLLKKCCFTVVEDNVFLEEDETAGEVLRSPIEEKNPKVDFWFETDIDDFMSRRDELKGDLYAGFDVGRKHHSAELVILEDHSSDVVIMRFKKEYRNEDFEKMKGELRYVLNNFNIMKMGIDDTGIGNQLAEELEKEYAGTCEGITFTNAWKEEVSTNIRCLFEAQQIAIPDKRNIMGQIHSIKRIVTEHGNLRLDAEKNKDHHGDIFWAIALASSYFKKAFASSLSVGKIPDEDDPHLREFPRSPKRVFTPKAPLVKQVKDLGMIFDPRRKRSYD